MLAIIGIILVVLSVLMVFGLFLVDSHSLLVLIVYAGTCIIDNWIKIAVVLFVLGLLALSFSLFH